MNTQQIGIHYGALAAHLSEQLTKQGMKFNAEDVDNFEKCIEGLTRLRFSGVIIDSQYDKILPKLHKKIISYVAKKNKLKVNPK